MVHYQMEDYGIEGYQGNQHQQKARKEDKVAPHAVLLQKKNYLAGQVFHEKPRLALAYFQYKPYSKVKFCCQPCKKPLFLQIVINQSLDYSLAF